MWEKLFFVALCVIAPVVWGVLVNWLFIKLGKASKRTSPDDSIFPDYQI